MTNHPPDSNRPLETPPLIRAAAPVLGEAITRPRRYAPANRRAIPQPAARLYQFGLIVSTLVAAVFCILYITKPVIIAEMEPTTPTGDPVETTPAIVVTEAVEKPSETTEPSETAETQRPTTPASTTPASTSHDGHEETNLRVQHVLDASTPDGDLSRIVLDVPVIYASRNLRWTEAEIAQAREILKRLADYHEQSRHLRDLGTDILLDWNHLIERSIPANDLRADSPSLPTNQQDSSLLPRPTILDSTESIDIRPSGP